MSKLGTVLEWNGLGLTCLPCYPDSKALLKGYSPKRTKLSIPEYISLFASTKNNVCLVTGESINGLHLVVLDFDDLKNYFKWTDIFNVDTYTVATRRPGRHAYFWTREQPESDLKCKYAEIKHSGMALMIPPSRLEEFEYHVIENKPILEVERIQSVIGEDKTQSRKENDAPSVTVNVTNSDNASVTVNVTVLPSTLRVSYSDSLIGRVRQALPLTTYLENFQPLPSSDNDRWYMSFCPAHNDVNKRSLSIDTYNGLCSCFAPNCKLHSSRGFDVVGVHSILTGKSNGQAAKELAEKLGF